MTIKTLHTREDLDTLVRRLLRAHCAHPDIIDDVSFAMLEASTWGVDTHGLAMLPGILRRAGDGRAQLERPAQIAHERGAACVIDAELSPGQHATMLAARQANERAKQHGVGVATVRNSTHFGCCTPFLVEVARQGFVGFVGSNSLRSMATFGLMRANLGNNPFGFAAPLEGERLMLFDASAAKMSYGRRGQFLRAGKELPEDTFITPEHPDDDTGGVCEIADSLEAVALPFGGFKGASVAVMVEVFSALLSAGYAGADTEVMREGVFLGPSHFVMAFAPEAFGVGDFAERMTSYYDGIRREDDRVRLPGDRAFKIREERTAQGIPVEDSLAARINDLCRDAGVSPLAGR
ncbi:MAG: Ldh family oxidoreductase [Myxococcota bacterium]